MGLKAPGVDVVVDEGSWGPAVRPIPEDMFIVAVGDVHGKAQLMERLYKYIGDQVCSVGITRSIVVQIGDLIDRGDESIRAIDLARSGIKGARHVALRGNHEERLLNFIQQPSAQVLDDWLAFGGREFLGELNIDPNEKDLWSMLPEKVGRARIGFLRQMPTMFRQGDLVFCHAGLNPRRSINSQLKGELIWGSEDYLGEDSPRSDGVAVVHGHYATSAVEIGRNRINIDTGAYQTGRLSAVLIRGYQMRVVAALSI